MQKINEDRCVFLYFVQNQILTLTERITLCSSVQTEPRGYSGIWTERERKQNKRGDKESEKEEPKSISIKQETEFDLPHTNDLKV